MPDLTLEALKEGFAISDIAAVIITASNKKYRLDVATEANARVAVDAGQEKALRKKNTILALTKTDDLVKGYDIDFVDAMLHPELLAIVEGGVSTFATGGAFTKFSGPVAGAPVTREAVQVDVYAENAGTEGMPVGYTVLTFKNAKGKPTEISIKDGDFWCPKLTFESRPAKGQPTMEISSAKELPTVPVKPGS